MADEEGWLPPHLIAEPTPPPWDAWGRPVSFPTSADWHGSNVS